METNKGCDAEELLAEEGYERTCSLGVSASCHDWWIHALYVTQFKW